MGVVYRAHDPRIGRDVALKIMRWTSATPEQLARFSREAQAAGSLNHPNIIAVYDVGTERGMPFVVTELLEGETLRDKMRPGLLPFRRAVEIGAQVANALDAAHRKSIWHRDVKPANVFITNDWRAKLLDFGIAKLSEPDAHAQGDIDTASQTAGLRGTPGYMSPEQVRGEAVDHRTDIFALGAVLYEMFTGKRAFQRQTPLETMNAVVHADPVDPLTANTSLSPVAAAVVRRCLEKNKEDRFQTARDLAFQLQQLKEPTTGSILPAPPPVPRRRWPWAVAALLLGAAAMALALWQLSAQGPTFNKLTLSRGRIGGARFTADGTGVVYSLATQGRELQVSRLDFVESPASRSLMFDPGTVILAVRAGQLALLLRPTFLQGERFSGTLGVAPVGSAPIERGQNIEAADWGPSGELAVVQSTGAVGGSSRIEYPQGTVLYATRNFISSLRVSPDGQHVAFIEDPGSRRGPSGTISIVDLNNKKVKILTKDWESLRGLAWANDREIWFAASDDESNRALRAVTLDGKLRLVSTGLGSLTLWDVWSDGRALLTLDEERRAVLARGPGETNDRDISLYDQSGLAAISDDGRWVLCGDRNWVYLAGTDGSQPKFLLRDAYADDLASDGQTLLATIDSGRKLVVRAPGAFAARPIPTGDIVQYLGAWWFPNSGGRRVLFTGKRQGQERPRSFVQDVADAAPTPITPEGTWGVAISQDGEWIAAIQGPGPPVQIRPVNGSGAPTEVPGVQESERPIAFSQDGKAIWLFRRGEIPGKVVEVDIATGRRQQAKTLSPPDTAGVYSIVDVAITPSGNGYAYSYTRVLSQLYLAKGLK